MPVVMKLAYSVSVALPRMMAPASRSLRVMKASSGGTDPSRATEPAVVGMSKGSTLSLSRTGTPNSGPRGSPRGGGWEAASGRPRAMTARTAIGRVGEVPDVPGFRVADDGHVVVGVLAGPRRSTGF